MNENPTAVRDAAAAAPPRQERGSALVTTMMVMVVMTVIGLSFLMMADTENQIAVSDRDSRQVLYVALSGAKLAESWFNVPDPAYNPLVPSKDDCNLALRIGDSDYNGTNDIDVPTNGTSQRYRGGTATGAYRLFDKPFRGAIRDTFWGSYDHPDVLITNSEPESNEYLDRMSSLFNMGNNPSLAGVQITEIRVFAPPFDPNLQRRFGICTITCRAAKTLRRGGKSRRVSEREVSFVLQEMPFPAPGAAIESSATVDVNGNFGVHWGGTYTEGDISLQSGSNFPGNAVPRENTSRYRYANFAPNAPDLDTSMAAPGVQNLLTQLLAGPVNIKDPWLNFRCVGSIAEATNNDDQPWPYEYANTGGVVADKSIFFQNQTYSFPELDYDFWKAFAQQRTRNSHYFKYTGTGGGGEPEFAPNGVGAPNTFAHWVNTENGFKPGVYFFDTTNARSPQNGGTGVLTPSIKVNSSTVDSASGDFIMEGLIFTNSTLIDSSGISGSAVRRRVNMPGEPFLDTGIDIDRDGTVGNIDEELETISNGVWDFAYLGSSESDGQDYDRQYALASFQNFAVSIREADGVVPNEGNDPRTVGDVVYEPFLNLAYPATGAPTDPCFVDYDYEATVQRLLGGDRNNDGTTDVMTSARDRRGAQVDLDLIVNGIWYNEGRYDGSGNLPAYGSILMKGGFTATGTPNIFFNEAIALGDWPPAEMKIPRVYASHINTD